MALWYTPMRLQWLEGCERILGFLGFSLVFLIFGWFDLKTCLITLSSGLGFLFVVRPHFLILPLVEHWLKKKLQGD